MTIDLHTHSTASDGTDTPAALVASAVRSGVSVLGITDHDTTGGWAAAAAAVESLQTPFTLIRGAEFSCAYFPPSGQRRIGLHLLGYLFDADHPGLKAERARLRENRRGRGEQIVDRLVAADYPITWERVTELAAGGSVGRPHIGQALVEAGVVNSVNDAFAELLSSASPYYVPKQDMDVFAAISMIRAAGGVPVIAHAWARTRGRILDEAPLAELVEGGLAGFEVDHADHDDADRRRLRAFAIELGIFTTGSSDYHGTNKSVRIGAESTSPEALGRLLAQASGVPALDSSAGSAVTVGQR
ncbi:PHP domain-containing protein [Jatrophihabitans telluris]|uniref:PHP domain-containing protein n=1 Tax=Jatrophihabitans telluris TaxID=2038343 RepID=A0ABY4R378_9ACTN|nr:PHP domain-containing protein [Jatrophihabitans telluris]UQX89706.1 PHP domain-containing protein [Jatrophihabitans telluris]